MMKSTQWLYALWMIKRWDYDLCQRATNSRVGLQLYEDVVFPRVGDEYYHERAVESKVNLARVLVLALKSAFITARLCHMLEFRPRRV